MSKEDIRELATVFECHVNPVRNLKVRMLKIKEKEYFDIRFTTFYTDKVTGEEKEAHGKGICLNKEFLPEIKIAIANIERWIKNGGEQEEEDGEAI